MDVRVPSYDGRGLVNLSAELERRLDGEPPLPGLEPDLAVQMPRRAGYVLVLFDGLGDGQLDIPQARSLVAARRGSLDAPFSTQTTVVTASLATGLNPARHGLLAYLSHLPEEGGVVNTIWWFSLDGRPCETKPEDFLPSPNLAERLSAGGADVVIVEPAGFVGSPLDRMLFRGATVLGYDDVDDLVDLTVVAAGASRLVVAYVPDVDAAAHTYGLEDGRYRTAVGAAGRIWELLAQRIPSTVGLVGTADHGHIDVGVDHRVRIDPPSGVILFGDSRVVYVRGGGPELASGLPATWVDRATMRRWWGPGPDHPRLSTRLPDGALILDAGYAAAFPGHDAYTLGNHGGLTRSEVEVPLLVRDG